MTSRNCIELLAGAYTDGRQLCVGLDPVGQRLPPHILRESDPNDPARHPYLLFCQEIVEATKYVAGAFKPNVAFFEALGTIGVEVLQRLVAFIHEVAPWVIVIGDAKRGDVGSTCEQHGATADVMGYDAMTINPYGGYVEGLDKLLDGWPDMQFFVWARSSNPGADDVQGVITANGIPVWKHVVRTVMANWNGQHNCSFVCGATWPADLAWLRAEVGPTVPILAPGIGTQGGDLRKAVLAGGGYTSFSSSSGLLFASTGLDFAHVVGLRARDLDQKIRNIRAEGQ